MRFSSGRSITKQMSFCEEDCVTNRTFARVADVAANDLARTSVRPTIPGPPTVTSVTSRMAVRAFTPLRVDFPDAEIFVPGFSGSKLLRIPDWYACGCYWAESVWVQDFCTEVG